MPFELSPDYEVYFSTQVGSVKLLQKDLLSQRAKYKRWFYILVSLLCVSAIIFVGSLGVYFDFDGTTPAKTLSEISKIGWSAYILIVLAANVYLIASISLHNRYLAHIDKTIIANKEAIEAVNHVIESSRGQQ